MTPFEDVQIVIDVNMPGALTGLGTPLLLVASDTANTYKEFVNADGVKSVFGENHSAYKMALVLENQGQYRPDKIAVATYTTGENAVAPDTVLRTVWDNDWYFVMLDYGTTAEKKAISDVIEGKAMKMAAHLVTSEVEALALKEHNYRLTMLFGVEPATDEEQANVAFIGANGSRTVGSITWKFKKLVGITPISDMTLALAYENANTNFYVDGSNGPRTRQGVVLSGEFIDSIHGQHWITINGQNAVQAVFDNTAKVEFENSGVALLVAALSDVLELAGRNGIIKKKDSGQYDYKINAVPIENLTAAERAERKYSGLSFEYYESGAIHEAKPIRGVVNF